MYTSPLTSRTCGILLPLGAVSCFGITEMVLMFSVTSSPTFPSPRVAACTSTPSSYRMLMARPSIFSSQIRRMGCALSNPFAALSPQACNSWISIALSRLVIGARCVTGAKVVSAGAPTWAVGESSVIRLGYLASKAMSSRFSSSYSASLISGAS